MVLWLLDFSVRNKLTKNNVGSQQTVCNRLHSFWPVWHDWVSFSLFKNNVHCYIWTEVSTQSLSTITYANMHIKNTIYSHATMHKGYQSITEIMGVGFSVHKWSCYGKAVTLCLHPQRCDRNSTQFYHTILCLWFKTDLGHTLSETFRCNWLQQSPVVAVLQWKFSRP